MTYELIEVRTEGGKVGIITLNRPKALNALNGALMDELGAALKAFDADEAIGCMIITGSEKAFAAGADIGAMASWTYMDVYKSDYITRNWETIRRIRKPVIAAVAGYALGLALSALFDLPSGAVIVWALAASALAFALSPPGRGAIRPAAPPAR